MYLPLKSVDFFKVRLSLVVHWLRLQPSTARGAWVQSLVRELRSHLLQGAAKNK